jgi:hypothetical protein
MTWVYHTDEGLRVPGDNVPIITLHHKWQCRPESSFQKGRAHDILHVISATHSQGHSQLKDSFKLHYNSTDHLCKPYGLLRKVIFAPFH